MIVFDTNVISELMKRQPNPNVVAWVAAQPNQDLFVTSVTKAEILYGIAVLPDGRRKITLADVAQRILSEVFSGRVLVFDEAAAGHYAGIAATRRRAGLSIDVFDVQIAAMALAIGADAVATRNVTDFEGCGIGIIDPWTVTA